MQRLRSADLSYASERNFAGGDTLDPKPSQKSQISTRGRSERALSVEGQLKRNGFRHNHSMSCTPSPRMRENRSSDGRLCGDVEPHLRRGEARSAGDLHSNRARGGEERLLDWNARTPNQDNPTFERRSRSLYRNSEKTLHNRRQKQLCACNSVPPMRQCSDDIYKEDSPLSAVSLNTRSRSSQIRRVLSLLSVVCDKEVEKTPKKRILRPPTKHQYRRGISGLPVRCSPNHLGLVY